MFRSTRSIKNWVKSRLFALQGKFVVKRLDYESNINYAFQELHRGVATNSSSGSSADTTGVRSPVVSWAEPDNHEHARQSPAGMMLERLSITSFLYASKTPSKLHYNSARRPTAYRPPNVWLGAFPQTPFVQHPDRNRQPYKTDWTLINIACQWFFAPSKAELLGVGNTEHPKTHLNGSLRITKCS